MNTTQLTLAAMMLAFVSSAQAGPNVSITVKNLSQDGPALLKLSNANEHSTWQAASPKPKEAVAPGISDTFDVRRVISPDMNAAILRYEIGKKVCVFSTTFTMQPSTGGVFVPSWNKHANPSGGAVCTATILRFSPDYSWAVEFTMK